MAREILVPLDGSVSAEAALMHAVSIAKKREATLVLMRVHPPPTIIAGPAEMGVYYPDPVLENQMRDVAEGWLSARAEALRIASGLPVVREFRSGVPAEEIVGVATARKVELIVCATHGNGGWAPQWMGSVTDAVVRHAPCPVYAMSVPAVARPTEVRKLLVLSDGSAVSDAIMPAASEFAKAYRADVELLRVVAIPWVGDAVPGTLTGLEDSFGVTALADEAKRELEVLAKQFVCTLHPVRTTVRTAVHPARSVLDHIKDTDPDAVAMATHGRGVTRLFLGSVADKVLRGGERPVLLVRSSQS
jgi:nucleotide-binding universal stress UspA family protein